MYGGEQKNNSSFIANPLVMQIDSYKLFNIIIKNGL